jgi:asparagine synthase (glutamine-hydrolysing)
MFSALLRVGDLGERWRPEPGGWRAGKSHLRAFAHPALHAALLVSPTRTLFIVRERIRGVPAAEDSPRIWRVSEEDWDRALAAARGWPLEFIALGITGRGTAAEVTLHTGHWGSAPVFLHVRDQTLRIEWDITRLYAHLASTRIDPSVAAEFVVNLDYPNSRRTLFPEILHLTERATATWRAPHARASVRYPAPALIAQPGKLARDADVPGVFREILSASMRRWDAIEQGRAVFEVSGGLDSSLVVATGAMIADRPVRSVGLIMPGQPGRHQQARRACLVRRFGLIDRTLHAIDFPPFAPESRRVRERAIAPSDEFYYEAAEALFGIAGAAGADVVFGGMGGDELASLVHGEIERAEPDDKAEEEPPERVIPPVATKRLREAYAQRERRIDCAPGPLLHDSTIESAGAVSRLCLRSGFWPVHPLCTPELVQFCRRLPFAWRDRRRIHRAVLASFGLPARLTHPRRATLEHFSDVMEFAIHSAARAGIEQLFAESRLAEQGLVDRAGLVEAFRAHCAARKNSEWLLGLVVLELTLRSVEHHRGAGSAAP